MTDLRPEAPATARILGLEPHPEGGWFRRTWAGTHPVRTAGGERPAATCIHYLLAPGERSAWHVVASDEIWLWHGPGVLELSLGGSGDEPGGAAEPGGADGAERAGGVERILLGPDLAAGHRAQAIVPAGVWQAARPVADAEVLVSCVVSPGFSFDDWRLAD